jgi:hypothetical protein
MSPNTQAAYYYSSQQQSYYAAQPCAYGARSPAAYNYQQYPTYAQQYQWPMTNINFMPNVRFFLTRNIFFSWKKQGL